MYKKGGEAASTSEAKTLPIKADLNWRLKYSNLSSSTLSLLPNSTNIKQSKSSQWKSSLLIAKLRIL